MVFVFVFLPALVFFVIQSNRRTIRKNLNFRWTHFKDMRNLHYTKNKHWYLSYFISDRQWVTFSCCYLVQDMQVDANKCTIYGHFLMKALLCWCNYVYKWIWKKTKNKKLFLTYFNSCLFTLLPVNRLKFSQFAWMQSLETWSYGLQCHNWRSKKIWHYKFYFLNGHTYFTLTLHLVFFAETRKVSVKRNSSVGFCFKR